MEWGLRERNYRKATDLSFCSPPPPEAAGLQPGKPGSGGRGQGPGTGAWGRRCHRGAWASSFLTLPWPRTLPSPAGPLKTGETEHKHFLEYGERKRTCLKWTRGNMPEQLQMRKGENEEAHIWKRVSNANRPQKVASFLKIFWGVSVATNDVNIILRDRHLMISCTIRNNKSHIKENNRFGTHRSLSRLSALSMLYTQCVELTDFQQLQGRVFFLFKRLSPWWLSSKSPALRVGLVRTYLTIVYRRASRVFVMRFVQQEIQSMVQDGVTDGTTSSLPDSHQFKARVPQGDTNNALAVPKWP